MFAARKDETRAKSAYIPKSSRKRIEPDFLPVPHASSFQVLLHAYPSKYTRTHINTQSTISGTT